MPATLDTSSSMMLLAAPESKDVVGVSMTKVVESIGFVHVWVRETMRGEGCVAHPGDVAPREAVVVPRIEKAVKFYVEEARAETCGDPPRTVVRCRRSGARDWSTKLDAAPGDILECEMTAEAKGKFAVVDRALLLGESPGGSTAKLAYQTGPTRALLRVDVFGAYTIRGEATDESGRKGTSAAVVQVAPPKTKDAIVELLWTGFDPSADPDTFPRLTLRAQAGSRECSLDKQPADLCEVKRFGAYTTMKLNAGDTRAPLTVRYVDERPEPGPVACVQVWFDGARTAETCDRKHRAADERWDVGTVDVATGKLVEPGAADAADGGAGASDAGAKPKPEKKK